MPRDYQIIKEIDRWRVCLGRHIRKLTSFTGQRACDIRLKKLLDTGYINRQKILYGVPYLYGITSKSKILVPEVNLQNKIRIEQITHDIAVLDTAIFLHETQGIPYDEIQTEKELHRKDGFATRKHRPDFTYTKNNQNICVEVELSLKAKHRLEQNIKSNFLAYDKQIWIVPAKENKITSILEENTTSYPIEIIELKEVQKND